MGKQHTSAPATRMASQPATYTLPMFMLVVTSKVAMIAMYVVAVCRPANKLDARSSSTLY
jgi:hypothetical protein